MIHSERVILCKPRTCAVWALAAARRTRLPLAFRAWERGEAGQAVHAPEDAFTTAWKPDLLGGIVTLTHRVTRPAKPDTSQPLYDTLSRATAQASTPGEVTLIPYCTFHNRKTTAMQVWIPFRQGR